MKMVSARRWPARPWSSGRARIAAGCAAASVVLLAGCQLPGSGSSGALEQAPAGSSITVASVPGVGGAPLYVAQQEGLFQQAGLTVHIRSYPTAAAEVAALRSGAANVAAGGYAGFFYAQEQATAPASAKSSKPNAAAVPMVVLADGYDAAPDIMDVLVRPDSKISSPQDLHGMTIGTVQAELPPNPNGAPYSLETVAASSVLENDGVRLDTVHFKPMPEDQLIGALKSGAVDAILVTEPQIYQAESQIGARSVLDACSGETVNLPLEGYFASASYAKKHQDALAAFHSALMRAQASANQPAPLNSALTHSMKGMSRETASLITVGAYPTSLRVSSLQRVADLMSFYGSLPRPLDVSRMVFP
jgi:NitT/TauT family transport system substrate-binding protein